MRQVLKQPGTDSSNKSLNVVLANWASVVEIVLWGPAELIPLKKGLKPVYVVQPLIQLQRETCCE